MAQSAHTRGKGPDSSGLSRGVTEGQSVYLFPSPNRGPGPSFSLFVELRSRSGLTQSPPIRLPELAGLGLSFFRLGQDERAFVCQMCATCQCGSVAPLSVCSQASRSEEEAAITSNAMDDGRYSSGAIPARPGIISEPLKEGATLCHNFHPALIFSRTLFARARSPSPFDFTVILTSICGSRPASGVVRVWIWSARS